MARNKRHLRAANRRVEAPLDNLTESMRDHVQGLGISSVDAYLAWCRRNHFERDVAKPQSDRQRERLHALRRRSEEFSSKQARLRNPVQTVRRLLAGDTICVPRCYLPIAEVMASNHPTAEADGRRELLVAILEHVCVVAPGLLHPDSVGLRTVVLMLDHWRLQLRKLDEWQPKTRNERRSLESLVHHVFARFPPSTCLTAGWFEDSENENAADYREWYLHCAQGNNLRTARLPVEYTRKMAHWFGHAPSDYGAGEALRFGQVLGLGGSHELARAVVATRLGNEFEHDAFWRTVIQFFVRHGISELIEVTSIVDYVQDQRFSVDTFVNELGEPQPAPQPNLCMKKRCPDVLRRQMAHWHAQFGRIGGKSNRLKRWQRSDIAGYREVEASADGKDDAERTWVLRELCSSAELRNEGSAMRHCVSSYTRACDSGHSKIFALRYVRGDKIGHVATIEVRNKAVAQVRARHNATPCKRAQAIVRRWATAVGLTIRSHAW